MRKYFYKDKDGAEKGPIGTDRLVVRREASQVTGRTLVRGEDSGTWIKLSKLPSTEFTGEDFSKMKNIDRIDMITNAVIGLGIGLGLPLGLAWMFGAL